MAPTLVTVAVGVLLGLALLGAAFDRRSLLVVAAAAGLADADAVASLVVRGATNALLHTLIVPAVAFVGLYWDTRVRERSLLEDRYGWVGVRVAWVALAAYVVAGIGLDLVGADGVALLYPLSDRFYLADGRFLLSSRDGLILTFVDRAGSGRWLASPGTTANHHVATWVNPTPGTGFDRTAARELHLVETGWQLVVVVVAGIAAAVRLRGER